MLAKVLSYGLKGITGYPVLIEIDVYNGLPAYEICGLPDTSVRESKERVRSAIKNSGFEYPTKKIIVNLAPADLRKEGSVYDLPIAIGILAASDQVSTELLKYMVIFGELSLNGDVRPVNGLLPMVISAYNKGMNLMVIPYENRKEIQHIEGIKVLPLKHLTDLTKVLNKEEKPLLLQCEKWENTFTQNAILDMKDIKGQEKAKRAMEIAAAGGHNILLIGSPGSGKSMLAKALPGILPDFTFNEALEVTQIHSVAGELEQSQGLISSRPYRNPHHTASSASIIGGGVKCLPGEISLAHRGVLYFDELPEFQHSVLEALRQPLEDGEVSISRANSKVTYPADFMFVASMNPCPCGNYGSQSIECRCSPFQIIRYLSKISGPLLDRMDLHIEMGRVDYNKLSSKNRGESSDVIKNRVNCARNIQLNRYKDKGLYCNAQLNIAQLKETCNIGKDSETLLAAAYDKLNLSARSYGRLLLVARTIADLEGEKYVLPTHVGEAIQYRSLDRKYWNQFLNQ